MKHPNLIGQENRLIYRLNEDVQSQVRYTSRVADANASRQEMQRAQNQLANGAPLTTTSSASQQALLDMQSRAAGNEYNAVQSGTRTGPSSADIMDQATISAQGLRTNFNQTTGNIRSDNTRVNTGQIDEAARERLMDNGMTPTQAALSVQGNRGDVQQAFNQVGTNSASNVAGSSSNIESQVRQQYADMGISDPAIINNGIASAIQADNARNQAADMASQKASSSASASAASNAAANEMQQSPQTQRALGSLEIGLAGLPPEDAAAIRAGLQATLGAQDQERSAAVGNYNDTMGQIGTSEKKSDALLNGMSKDADAFYEAASKFAEENAARREESAARQREETINRLKWEEDKGRRQMKAANDKQVNSLILGQALGGGFGSSNWIAEVADAEWAGEQALVDLSKEFGFKRADVDIAYTNTLDGIYETAGQKKLEALKEYKSDRQNISQLRFASSEKNDERRLTAKQTLNDKLAQIGKEQAAEIKDATKEVRNTLTQMRSEKRMDEQFGWNQLEQAIDTYGSGNVPQSLLDSISKKLPGVDIAAIAQATTAEERKKLSSGSGSGFSFPANLLQSGGIPPTFESYLSAKEKELNKSLSQPERDKLKKEYDGMKIAYNQLNPATIYSELNQKAKGLAQWQYSLHKDAIDGMLTSGDYAGAREYLDGVGEQLPGASADIYKSAGQLTSQINTFERLYKQAEDRLGPISGRTWAYISKYAESDPLFFELQAQQRLMLGAVARGPLQQKGMLSDTDIAMATDVLGNPSMNLESTLGTLRLLRQTLQTNAQVNLDLDSRNGYSVKDTRAFLEGSMGFAKNDPLPLDPYTESALDSFLSE